MRRLLASVVFAAAAVLLPSLVLAQGTLTGTVRDASGAVLPGVTVEAASDVLIEKVRTATTGSTGQWRIVDLRPGLYRVTFTLNGFQTVVREAVEMTGSATLTIPAELRVGNLAEEIVVTAETPVVDVQSVKREVVLQSEFIQSLPATRNYSSILQMIPAINVGFAISSETTPEMQLFTARGGDANEGRITIDGMTVAAPFNGGGVSSTVYNTSDVTEIQVEISGGLGENETGGPRMNIIPRSGGNSFRGSAFLSTAGDWSRSENIDDELRGFGITRGPALKAQWDTSGSYGGPIKRDRLWFYGSVRTFQSGRHIERGALPNLAAGDPNRWDYVADTSITEVLNVQSRHIYSGRLTGQIGKHRISFSQENQYRCDGASRTASGTDCRQPKGSWMALGSAPGFFGYFSPEAHAGYFPNPYYTTQSTWTMPMTNRLLLEAGYSRLAYEPVFGRPPSDGIFDIIPVTEQAAIDGHSSNFTYRAIPSYLKGWARNNNARASLTYVTGAHNAKIGYQGAFQLSDDTSFQNETLTTYRFNRGNPNQFTINLPDWQDSGRTIQHSVYAQDQWTVKRLTLQGAVRFDHAYSWSPVEGNGTSKTSPYNPQPVSFDRTVSVRGYNDVTSRFGVAYDLFGTGKTALKANVGKYLDAATNDSNYTVNNPANRVQRSLNRSWVDVNGNRRIDCDVLQPARQEPTAANPALRTADTCGALTGNSLLFGNLRPVATEVNPAILGGWGVRPYDWQFGVAVQQEVLPRVSVEVAYNRRWWGNFFVTDDRNESPDMYTTWVATAPTDPRLPGGGGYEITRYIRKSQFVGLASSDYRTFETDFGPARTNYWHGVEVTLNARMRNGLTFQGGTSTGREVEDTCETEPKIDSPDPRNCRDVDPFRTSFRGSASYTVPKVDVLVSGIARFSPSPALTANYLFPNSIIFAQLGANTPSNLTANGNQNVNLLDNDRRLFAERSHYQFDMRFAKIFRIGRTRADLGFDLYNIFNVNTPTVYDGTYDVVPAAGLGPGGQWLQPTGIVQPRFARFNLTVNF
jgi:hypothetical protein